MSRPIHLDLLDAAETAPERVAAISVDGKSGMLVGGATYRELAAIADRASAGLANLGVGRGDVVAVMLRNRWEFSALVFAISKLGAVYTGIPIAAGVAEAGHMLRKTGSTVLVIGAQGRKDAPAFVTAVRKEEPGLDHIVVMEGDEEGGHGCVDFAELCGTDPLTGPTAPADELAHLGFTSGTTGPPKAVMNTHATLGAILRRWVTHVGGREAFGDPAVNLVASPIGHHTGFLWGALLSAHLAATAIYLDRWVPTTAAQLIARHGVTTMHGAPTFLHDLTRVSTFNAEAAKALRIVTVAGAPIPRQLVPVARSRLDAFICPAWGMTEYGIGISAHAGMHTAELDASDGSVVNGCEARVVIAGRPAPPGRSGSLEIRGEGLFRGYYKDEKATAEAISPDGWFATGDVARIDGDGSVTLEGRTKDIIIRGGENIPAGSIEAVLFRHPDIVEAAVVGIADDRLGERACAVVVCEPGHTVELAEINRFCLSEGLSTHHLPESLELRESLPRTMSGKVRKATLREELASADRT